MPPNIPLLVPWAYHMAKNVGLTRIFKLISPAQTVSSPSMMAGKPQIKTVDAPEPVTALPT